MASPLDYKLNKMFYDLHTIPGLADEYRQNRHVVIVRYAISPTIASALERDDVAALAPHTNGFLMRYYFFVAGLSEQEFLAQLHAMRTDNKDQIHG